MFQPTKGYHFEDARSRFKVRFLPGLIRSPSPRASYHLAWLVADLPEVARSSSAWQAVASSRARNLTFFKDPKEVTPKIEMLMLQLGLKEQIQGVAAQAAWAPQLLSLCQGLQDLLSELRTFWNNLIHLNSRSSHFHGVPGKSRSLGQQGGNQTLYSTGFPNLPVLVATRERSRHLHKTS